MSAEQLAFTAPPHNLDAERAVLGGIMTNNIGLHQVGHLKDEHFYEPVHGRIFAAMRRLIDAGGIADPVTLIVEFERDATLREIPARDYLAAIARSAESLIEIAAYAEHLIELAGKRALAELARDAQAMAMDGAAELSLAEQLGRVRSTIDLIDQDGTLRPAWKSMDALLGQLTGRLAAGTEVAWSTSLPTLDQSLGGGLAPATMMGIQARMGVGKTMLLGTIAMSLTAQDVPWLFICCEMGAERILERMVASETGCNSSRFRQRLDPDDCDAKITSFRARYGHTRGYWAYQPGLSFDRLRSIAEQAAHKLAIRVLLLDYLQLITGAAKGQTKAEFFFEVAQWLAAFSGQHDAAVVLSAQTNRAGDVYGSDGLAMACDWLGALQEAEITDRMTDDQLLWVEVVKNRDGAAGNLGSPDSPAFRIDKIGPRIREVGDHTRSRLPPVDVVI